MLKTKHFYRKEISKKKYLASAEIIVTYLRHDDISIQEVDLTDYEIYNEVEKIVKQYELDISDAFQLATLKAGFPSVLEGESKTILITGDKDLEKAARMEGFRTWNILDESEPK